MYIPPPPSTISQALPWEAMKVTKQSTGGFLEYEPSLLSLSFKRLRPLPPKNFAGPAGGGETVTTLNVKTFIKHARHAHHPKAGHAPPVESQQSAGGSRWNPTQEQIAVLEALYGGGMRTPNAQKIDQITAELRKYGKIEGKNVFYWFQNHKARERQKQKRAALALDDSSTTPAVATEGEVRREYCENNCKRKCRSWSIIGFGGEGDGGGDRTLELFPLHPEGK